MEGAMDRITITEALAELKTIQKRIEKKRDFIGQYLARSAAMRDPLEKDGGSFETIRKEKQSIGDLQKRFVDIRCAINKVNLETKLTLKGRTLSIAEWIIWRRNVAPTEQSYTGELVRTIESVRRKTMERGGKLNPEEDYKKEDVVISLNETELHEYAEGLEELLGTLDGKFSLINATTFIKV
jgi:hypothetical protein